MKKMLLNTNLFALIFALLISLIPAPTVDAASNKAKAEKVVKTYINATKSYNINKMNKCFRSKPKNAFFFKKKAMAKYCRKYNKKTTYQIKSTKIKGKSGTIKVSVTSPDCYYIFLDAFEDFEDYYVDYYLDHGRYPSSAKANTYLMNSIKYYTYEWGGVGYNTRTITFKMIKTKRGWKIQSASRRIKDIANCRYEEAHDDSFD